MKEQHSDSTMKDFTLGLLSLLVISLSFTEPVHGCSCNFQRNRPVIIRDTFCFSQQVYVATVVGATCNCVNPVTEGDTEIYCQDYQLQEGSSDEVGANVVGRGRCSVDSERLGYFSELYRNCTALGTENVGIVPSGVTVEGPSNSNLSGYVNLTNPNFCDLICPFNQEIENVTGKYDREVYRMQPCRYQVVVGEVFKGEITEGDVLTLFGPDVLTSCGDAGRLLRINQRYLVGIGGACTAISEWSLVDSYSTQEIESLRNLRTQYESESIDCGAFGLLPSSLLLIVLAVLMALA